MRFHGAVGAVLLAGTAWAAEDAPKYLLAEAGVRVDLPDGWTATRWTDAALEADGPKGKLFVSYAPGQVAIKSADLPAWTKVFERTAENIGASDPSIRKNDVTDGGAARVDLSFTDAGRKGVLAGATVPVSGRVVHLALVGLAANADWLDTTLDELVGRLDVREPAGPLAGGDVVAKGITTALPGEWHVPLPAELAHVTAVAGKLGLTDLEPCWTAVRGVAGAAPDVAVACSMGISLGVVDALSFEDVDAKVLRPRLFGEANVAPATRQEVGDRLAFVYRPESAAVSLRMGVIPHGTGAARVWVVGDPGRGDALDPELAALLAASRVEGEHPVGPGGMIAYYLSYQPFSPFVIGPVLALLAGIVLAIRVAAFPRPSPVDDIA